MEEIRSNRKDILTAFFQSIGITAEASEAWEQLQSKVTPLPDDFKCFMMAMK